MTSWTTSVAAQRIRATLAIGRVVLPSDVTARAVHTVSNTALTGATHDNDGGHRSSHD
jgi:hypothetical protein